MSNGMNCLLIGTYIGFFEYVDEFSGLYNSRILHGQYFKGMRKAVSVFIGVTTFICYYWNCEISYFVTLNCNE
jgi:hypothetical protein